MIMNHMYMDGRILDKQTQGLIVCLPKTQNPACVDAYRPVTLLNTDYKTLARTLGDRMLPWFAAVLHKNQHCGVEGNSVLEAVATVREAVAQA